MSNGCWMLLGAVVAAPVWFGGAAGVPANLALRAKTLRANQGARPTGRTGATGRRTGAQIKNPLSTVNMNLKLLAEDIARQNDPESQRSLRRLASVQVETARLKDILNDFLRYAGRMELAPEVIDLRRHRRGTDRLLRSPGRRRARRAADFAARAGHPRPRGRQPLEAGPAEPDDQRGSRPCPAEANCSSSSPPSGGRPWSR